MTTPRQSITDFSTQNAYYAGATVTLYEVDESLEVTETLATVYAGPTGAAQLANPQTLDSRGRWPAPVYVDTPVVMEVTRGLDVRTTGVAAAVPRWMGTWASGERYFPGDRFRIPGGPSIGVVLEGHVAGTYLSDLGDELFEIEWSGDSPSGIDLSVFGEVDATGATDMAAVINAGVVATAADNEPLWIGKGTYRLDSPIYVQSNMDIRCHPDAEFIAYFDNGGRSAGIVAMTIAQWNALPDNPPRRIRITGGIWRRAGTVSLDGQDWEGEAEGGTRGYNGSVFAFWASDVVLKDMRITGWNRGRAIQPGGEFWVLDNIDMTNPDNYLSLPCPGIGGTGAVRWYSGGPMVASRLRIVCGDDALAAVPAALDLIGEDIHDIVYTDCHVVSIKARACVVALVIPASYPDEQQGSQTLSIKSVTFRGIRGEAKVMGAFYNTDSSGDLGTVLFDDVRVSIRTDLDGEAAPYAIELLGSDDTAGAGPIIFRDCELLNRIEGGLRCRGVQVNELMTSNLIIPAPDNAATVYLAVQVQDARKVSVAGGTITGAPTGTASLVTLGRSDEAFAVELARFDQVEFIGVPSAQYAIQGSTYGAVRLEVDRCVATPLDGVTDARFLDFPDNCTSALITGNRLGEIGATPYINIPAGAKFRDNVLSSAATNGIVHQQVAAASTIAWNGWSRVLRLTAAGDVTIDTISIPAGHEITDTPMIALYAINNFSLTLSSAGNIAPAGSTVMTVGTTVFLIYDYVGEKWMQAGHHAPSARTTSTQSAGGGSLTWTSGRALIRINVAGTVTSISGTPTQPDVVTLRAVHTTGTLIIQHGASAIRLKSSSNVTLAQNDVLTLQYDTSNGYWFEVSRSVA